MTNAIVHSISIVRSNISFGELLIRNDVVSENFVLGKYQLRKQIKTTFIRYYKKKGKYPLFQCTIAPIDKSVCFIVYTC